MGRILGLDAGEKRIGVALSDPLMITAQSKPYLPNDDKKWQALQELVKEYDIDTIVVGLPKNRDGSDSEKALEIRAFATEMQGHVDCKIEFWDERHSTQAVNRHLISANVRRKERKEVVDSQAAAFVLQGYMDRLGFQSRGV
jgi:putative Holliday junction resolvase